MDFSACVKSASENPVTYIATADGVQPRVRVFALWFCDTTGFNYYTGNPKKIFSQMKKNPKVELCFFKPGEGAGTMMRVAGMIEFLKDKVLKERLLRDRPWVKDLLAAATEGWGSGHLPGRPR